MKKECQTKTPPLYVTKPDLPDFNLFTSRLKEIWESRWLTNNGPFENELNDTICQRLNIDNCILFSNGTQALQAALACLNLSGEVITTPYSFVATALSLEPSNLKPKFVDLDPKSLCICPNAVRAAITKNTSAILAVHTYANPCAVEEIEAIAREHELKVIYDAAHCFGAQHNGRSLLDFGDISITSFHTTKVFHTTEGGAAFTRNKEHADWMNKYKSFGFNTEGQSDQCGTNSKMNEIQALMGILNLDNLKENIEKRKNASQFYDNALKNIDGITLVKPQAGTVSNHTYYPLRVHAPYPINRDALFDHMKKYNIHTRRYFHPLITDMPYYEEYKQDFPVASKIANEIICLPLFSSITEDEQTRVINAITEIL